MTQLQFSPIVLNVIISQIYASKLGHRFHVLDYGERGLGFYGEKHINIDEDIQLQFKKPNQFSNQLNNDFNNQLNSL